MQTKPSGWAELFASSHKTEYKFVIDEVEYTKSNIQGTPIITKPYMDKLCIGRCCSGTLSLQIRPIDSTTIPKAASVVAYCRLRSQDGATVTDWIEQGHYYISSRKTNGEILSLMCRDTMMKAGAVYLDYTAFTEWPVTMTAAVNEIASIMGISVDSRTVISTNADYIVSYPNDLLMSEVLSMIAAAHGGNFIITEKNELRLLPLPRILSSADNKCDIGGAYQIYETESTTQMISRVTLEDDAGNKFTAGSDGGLEVTAKCSYATQAIADDLCASGTGSLYAVKFTPYSVKGAYLDPCTELGDLLQLTSKGTTMYRMIASMNIRCNVSFNADVSCKSDFDDEEEFPYISARDLQASRYIRTDQKYHGNRIDRVNGFTSEYMVNGKVAARLIANSTVFSMQRVVDDSWEDCIYFDAVTQKYVITGNVDIKGIITAESLSAAGSTTINGANITTGILKSKDGKIQLDLDAGTFRVGDKDLSAALTAVENSITLLASSQIFTKASGATAYTPTNITLTAQSTGTLSSYTWYRDNTVISGESSQTLTVSASDFTANSATYKVVGKDAAGNTYTDSISIAKLSDGKDGVNGQDGKDGVNGQDGKDGVNGQDGKDGVKGDKGDKGDPGVSYYTWIKYADSPTSGMSDLPDSKKYIGLAYNKTTAAESTNYSDYEWSLIKGEDGKDGVNGTKGADGTTYYTWVKYADNASGSGMTNDPTGKEYIGLAYNKTTPTESSNAADYTWALFKGSDGVNGQDGKDGAKGDKGDPGAGGADGHTVILSNEFIEIPVDVSHKPLADASYSCKVDVYKGLAALAPTTGGPTASQFKVTMGSAPPGITASQPTPGTIALSVGTGTALSDVSEIPLTIAVSNAPDSPIPVRNLVTDGSFENCAANWITWSTNPTDTAQAKHGTQSLKLGGDALAQQYIEKPVAGHKYYGREWLKTNGELTASDCRFEIISADAAVNEVYIFGWNLGNHPGWTIISDVITIDSTNASAYQVRTFTVGGSVDAWVDGLMIVDLTAAFGAGNEPDKAWCDANIPFETTTTSLSAKITVRANMNDVVVSQQAAIKVNADNILLRVEKSGVISAINQSAEAITIDAKHLNLNGYVTVTSLENGSTTINGSCITTGTIDASKVSVTNLNASNIISGTLSASRISGGVLDASQITVSNLSASSITSGTLNASKVTISNLSASSITSGTLDASKVTVKNLDASSITSGTISADRVDISSLKVDKIYTTTSTGVTKNVAIASSTTTRLMVGGDGTWNFDYTTIYAGTQIEIQAYGDLTSNSKLLFDTKNHIIKPETSGLWSLGGNAWFFKVAYIRDGIYLKDSHQCITSTDIGTSLYPWSKIYTTSAYVTNLYLNNTLFDPSNLSISKLTYSSSIYASLNSSKQFVPAAATGYYLGNSTYPWQYAYITNLYINGTKFDPSASSGNFAGSAVTMGGSTSYYILCNTSRELRPYSSSTTYPCYLGTSTYYWHYAYIGSNTVSIGSGTSSKLGFFGTAPIAKQTLSTSSNNMSYSSVTSSNYLYALNNLIGILKNKYGLIS